MRSLSAKALTKTWLIAASNYGISSQTAQLFDSGATNFRMAVVPD
jgi:hypothetical protein